MEIFFCDACSKRITEGDLSEGSGADLGDVKYCQDCLNSRPELRAAVEAAPHQGESARRISRQTALAGSCATGTSTKQPLGTGAPGLGGTYWKKSRVRMGLVAVVSGLLIGAAAGLMVMRSAQESGPPLAPALPPATARVPSVGVPVPAADEVRPRANPQEPGAEGREAPAGSTVRPGVSAARREGLPAVTKVEESAAPREAERRGPERTEEQVSAHKAIQSETEVDEARKADVAALAARTGSAFPTHTVLEEWTLPNGSSWPEQWTLEGALDKAATREVHGGRGRLGGRMPSSGVVVAYVNTLNAEDVEASVTFNISSNGMSFGMLARRADTDSDTYYCTSIRSRFDGVSIFKCVDGKGTRLAGGGKGKNVTPGKDWRMRFTVQTVGRSTALRVKVWEAGSPEPEESDAEVTDAESRLQGVSGRFGLRYGLFHHRLAMTDEYEAKLHGMWDERILALAKTPEERKRLMTECVGRPAADGYFLSLKVLLNLSKRYDREKTIPKRLGAMGGAVAGSSMFDRSLRGRLTRAAGYSFANKLGLAGRSVTAKSLRKGFHRRLEREKPELVRILFDVTELVRAGNAKWVRADLAHFADTILELGAVPVLMTLPVPASVGDERIDKLIAEYNAAVFGLASKLNVPCLDCFGILNAEPVKRLKFFGTRGALARKGMQAVNEKFLALYGILERWVMSRNRPERYSQGAGNVSEGAATVNLVANGSFEVIEDASRFAARWRPYQWGREGAAFSVRIDRGNPCGGKRAVVVRGVDSGAKPGVFITLTKALPPGDYTVSFWACCDVDETARVHSKLGDRELDVFAVGEEWKQFSQTVTVEKRLAAATLRLWTSSFRVRVWFDDVGVWPGSR